MCPSEQDAFDLIEALTLCGPLRIIRSDAVCLVDETDSTNALALEPGLDGAVYLAERQRTGRGRFGRSWHSAPGLGLWFSVRLTGNPDGLLFAAGLAMRDALGAFVPVSLKWPNDIMSGCRKICGMLLERRDGRIALGIGAIGMVNTMMTSVFERTREIAVLRALGWRRRRVVRMVLMESAAMALLGAVLGTAAALALIAWVAALPAAASMVPRRIAPEVIAQGFAVALGVGLIGGIYPAWRAARLLPTEGLRHE